jgi:hypothetical protein
VFSIFELNPAPFCLLDEVDAPLDEHNVGRFCDIVRDMSSRVQFVFVTHNKATMELANQLLGVTMNEPGVFTARSGRRRRGPCGFGRRLRPDDERTALDTAGRRDRVADRRLRVGCPLAQAIGDAGFRAAASRRSPSRLRRTAKHSRRIAASRDHAR